MITHKPKLQIKKECLVCLRDFMVNRSNQIVCSQECRIKYYAREGMIPIASQSVGCIAEMMICAEMLRRGYSAFRAVSASSFCDVIAVKGKEILMLEVRTGYKSMNGKLMYPKKLSTKISYPTHYAVYIFKSAEVEIIKI